MTITQEKISDYILRHLCACATPAEVEALEKIAVEPLKKEIEELKKQLREKCIS